MIWSCSLANCYCSAVCFARPGGGGGVKIGDEFLTFIVECKVKRIGGWWLVDASVCGGIHTGVANHIFFKLDG